MWGGSPPSVAGAEFFGHLEAAPIKGGVFKAGPIAAEEYQRDVVNNVSCMIAVVVALAVFQFTPKHKLSDFAARKLTHVSMGTLLLLLKQEGKLRHLYVKLFILLVATLSILSSLFKPFRFAKQNDRGVILFNVLVGLWTLFDLPLATLAPMFYADPSGAVVGRLVESRKWIGEKTVAGSAAVFVVTFLSAYTVTCLWHRLVLAALCTILEATGGDCDNLLMSLPVIAYFFVFQKDSEVSDNDIFGGISIRGGLSFS
ncbi:phosphatidate cytidylyltransferase [Besnoitia besnoiti]|uniref:Phosphatidate cytidylyltransferase n=1 Tax=Besnoitia besnoiti TaxID=94643 RepID=A0A2A9M9P4_BESBE|nr:phosphatidate cytidylyltransferase [Besnoitia besnoiti]PFH32646.1 phosphatidate cytidylyltransferase [Besnoitia besnoiti]